VSACDLAGTLISIRVGLVDGSERKCLGLLPDFRVKDVDGRLSINGKSWGSSDRSGRRGSGLARCWRVRCARWAVARLVWLLALIVPIVSRGGDGARAQVRLALVIGNSGYLKAPLANPRNDARGIARSLTQSGFSIRTLIDADQQAMRAAIMAFGRELRGADSVGLFYYAGDGVQVDGQNYLIPVGADTAHAGEVPLQASSVSPNCSRRWRLPRAGSISRFSMPAATTPIPRVRALWCAVWRR